MHEPFRTVWGCTMVNGILACPRFSIAVVLGKLLVDPRENIVRNSLGNYCIKYKWIWDDNAVYAVLYW